MSVGTDEKEQAQRDAAIEVEVDIAFLQFASARTPAQRKRAHDRFVDALKRRSPETVRRMELDKGLRRT